MTVLWDKIKKNIVETLNEAIDKTEEVTSVGRIKLEILRLEQSLDEEYTELGKYVHKKYPNISGKLSDDKKLASLNRKIKKLEEDISKKEKELCRIREEDGIDFDS